MERLPKDIDSQEIASAGGNQWWPIIFPNIALTTTQELPMYCPALAWANGRPWFCHPTRVFTWVWADVEYEGGGEIHFNAHGGWQLPRGDWGMFEETGPSLFEESTGPTVEEARPDELPSGRCAVGCQPGEKKVVNPVQPGGQPGEKKVVNPDPQSQVLVTFLNVIFEHFKGRQQEIVNGHRIMDAREVVRNVVELKCRKALGDRVSKSQETTAKATPAVRCQEVAPRPKATPLRLMERPRPPRLSADPPRDIKRSARMPERSPPRRSARSSSPPWKKKCRSSPPSSSQSRNAAAQAPRRRSRSGHPPCKKNGCQPRGAGEKAAHTLAKAKGTSAGASWQATNLSLRPRGLEAFEVDQNDL